MFHSLGKRGHVTWFVSRGLCHVVCVTWFFLHRAVINVVFRIVLYLVLCFIPINKVLCSIIVQSCYLGTRRVIMMMILYLVVF